MTTTVFSDEQSYLDYRENGQFDLSVWQGDRWVSLGLLGFGQKTRTETLPLPALDLAAGEPVMLAVSSVGDSVAHLDAISLGGAAPFAVSNTQEASDLALTKLGTIDRDLIDASGDRAIVAAFDPAAWQGGAPLAVSGRIEPPVIGTDPFQFPVANVYKSPEELDSFYVYRPGTNSGELTLDGELDRENLGSPFFKEWSQPGSGHPANYTYGWVRDDGENLYVAIDFASDNTLDIGNKDYGKVFVNTDAGVREFEVTVPDQTWGTSGFTYTNQADYQHKTYEFAIPFSEIGGRRDRVELAFATYGTSAVSNVREVITGTDVAAGTSGLLVGRSVLTRNGSDGTVNNVEVRFSQQNTVTGSDVSSFTLFASADDTLDAGDTQLATTTGAIALASEPITTNFPYNFAGLSQAITAGNSPLYLLVAADISGSATAGSKLLVSKLTASGPNIQGASGTNNTVPFNITAAPAAAPTPSPRPQVQGGTSGGGSIPDGEPIQQPLSNTLVGTPTTRNFFIENPSQAPLEIGKVELPDGFSIVGQLPSSIPPGGKLEFTVQLDANAPGIYAGPIAFFTNAVPNPVYNFTLIGEVSVPTVPTVEELAAKLSGATPVTGTPEGDTLLGGEGSQRIEGLDGDDILYGNQGIDLVTAGNGNDAIFGGKDDDCIFGGAGDDLLAGDFGNDTLIGGDGSDAFVLGAGRGTDTIFDFTDGVDRFLLESGTSFADLAIVQAAGFTSIQLPATGEVLANVVNVPAGAILANDFGTFTGL